MAKSKYEDRTRRQIAADEAKEKVYSVRLVATSVATSPDPKAWMTLKAGLIADAKACLF